MFPVNVVFLNVVVLQAVGESLLAQVVKETVHGLQLLLVAFTF